MPQDEQTNDGQDGLSEETLKLAALGRGDGQAEEGQAGDDEGKAPEGEGGDKPQRPDHVPEKFWDAEKGEVNLDNLLKSYTELEKSKGKPKDGESEEGKEEAGKEKEGEEGSEKETGIAPELFDTAQAEWSEKGQLSEKTRKSILDSGIPEATLDTYLAGVAALSASMTAQVYEIAGGEDDYKAALKWAGEKWDTSRISKFDNGIDDADLREPLIKGLMADYRAANPGEGRQTRPGEGGGDSDVYTTHDEFQKDLAKADAENDLSARKKAVEKLARSRKAKSLTTQNTRPGLSRFNT